MWPKAAAEDRQLKLWMATRGVCVPHSGHYNKLTRVPWHPRLGARRGTELHSISWAMCSTWVFAQACSQCNVALCCFSCDDIMSFSRNVINTIPLCMGMQDRKLGLQDPIWSQGWRSCEVTHDRPPSFHIPSLFFIICSEKTSPRVSPPADGILYLFSGQHFLNSFLGLGTCFLWVPWWSSPQLAPLVHLTDWHYPASGSSVWHSFPSGDGQTSQVRKLLTSSSPQQLSGWLSSKFCPHNKHPSDLAATQWDNIWSGGSCSFLFTSKLCISDQPYTTRINILFNRFAFITMFIIAVKYTS